MLTDESVHTARRGGAAARSRSGSAAIVSAPSLFLAKINIPHTKCEKGQTKSFLTGSAIFSYTHLENLAQVYRVNYLYIIYVI